MNYDKFGSRLKKYEALSTSRCAFKGQPIILRLDGKSFHSFCQKLEKPYDEDLINLFISTTKYLASEFQSVIAYHQSDEITLSWYIESNSQSEYIFNGRFQKLESIIASACTAFFNSEIKNYIPNISKLALFDCRAFVVPNLLEAYHVFLWRQQDCTKNAIFSTARTLFSHKELHHKQVPELQEMMFNKYNINFNNYISKFKRGTFIRKEYENKILSSEKLDKIPIRYHPIEQVKRAVYNELDIWLEKQLNPIDVLFYGAKINDKN